MKKIKFAFVGTGYMANQYAKVIKKEFNSQSEIVGAINKSSESIKLFVKNYNVHKSFVNLTEMMNSTKPDIVVVCVNELSTFKVLETLSKYSCISLIEKPVGINFEESKKILKLKKNKKFLPYVALNRRFYSSVLSAKKILMQDKSPRIINIFDQENSVAAKKSGQPNKVVKNWMYANSIHMIDFAYNFARGKIKKMIKTNKVQFLKEGIFSTVLYFDSGDIVKYNSIWNRPAPWTVQVSTKKYFIELKPIEEISFLTNESRKWNTLKKSILDKKYKPGIYLLLQEVLNLKKGKKTNLQNLKYSNKLMKLIRKIYFD